MLAQWSTLTEFTPLRPAETILMEACRTGRWSRISAGCPANYSRNNTIRARFVRFLAMGGSEEAPVHAKGLQLQGAYIVGELDLEGCEVRVPLWLCLCNFGQLITLRDATLRGLYLSGSRIKGLRGDRLFCKGGLFFRATERRRFVSTGPIYLQGAEISGNLDFKGADLAADKPGEDAFRGIGAKIHGRLVWQNVRVRPGNVNLRGAFATVLSDNWESWAKVDAYFLDGLTYERIDTAFTGYVDRLRWLNRHSTPDCRKLREFWPQPWEQLARVLKQMGHEDEATVVAIAKQRQMRRCGVIGQRTAKPSSSWPARKIYLAFTWLENLATRALHLLYGSFARYGYRPMRTVVWMVSVWLVGFFIFAAAERGGMMGPTDAQLVGDPNYASCASFNMPRTTRWTRCAAMPAEYPRFNAIVYSLDLILPLVDLRQEAKWGSVTRREDSASIGWDDAVQWFTYIEILFGWAGSLLLVAAFSRLVEKDQK